MEEEEELMAEHGGREEVEMEEVEMEEVETR